MAAPKARQTRPCRVGSTSSQLSLMLGLQLNFGAILLTRCGGKVALPAASVECAATIQWRLKGVLERSAER